MASWFVLTLDTSGDPLPLDPSENYRDAIAVVNVGKFKGVVDESRNVAVVTIPGKLTAKLEGD